MSSTTKVKIVKTTCKIALLYSDNTSEIKDVEIVGKYSLSTAKKYIKSDEYKKSIENLKNIEVLQVETNLDIFECDTTMLFNFLNDEKVSTKIEE